LRRSQPGLVLSTDSVMWRFGEGHGCPCLNRRYLKRSFGEHRAQLVLGGHKSASGFAVDAASQLGDDGFAVLGENQRLAFLELADLLGAQDGNIVAGEGAASHCSGLPGPPRDTDLPDQVGDLLVEGAAANHIS
jgi:hypothetical protein